MRLAELDHADLAILGLGQEGQAVRQVLSDHFPDKPVALLDEQLSVAKLERLKRHPDDQIHSGPFGNAGLEKFQVLVRSPGVSIYRTAVADAVRRGVQVTTASGIWFAENPAARTVCITGTKGKSTTAALTAHLLRALGLDVELAGNIGVPLIQYLTKQADIWVIELSSYQCADLVAKPTLAVLLNLSQEHLDWHGSQQQYHADKIKLLEQARLSIVNGQDTLAMAQTGQIENRSLFNTAQGFHHTREGVFQGRKLICSREQFPLRGRHNLGNLCAALTVVEQLGYKASTAIKSVGDFKGLPHRLEVLGKRAGKLWINDSIATTPDASRAALEAFSELQVTLLAGGFERGLEWAGFAGWLSTAPPFAVICMPDSGSRIIQQLKAAAVAPEGGLHEVGSLAEAVELARKITPAGGCILLSPGAASFPQFKDFQQRGAEFAALAGIQQKTGR